jgi:hypothetical protein
MSAHERTHLTAAGEKVEVALGAPVTGRWGSFAHAHTRFAIQI